MLDLKEVLEWIIAFCIISLIVVCIATTCFAGDFVFEVMKATKKIGKDYVVIKDITIQPPYNSVQGSVLPIILPKGTKIYIEE